MDAIAARTLAERLFARHGLTGWSFGFNRRVRSLGICWHDRRRIELSSHFAAAHDEADIADVILHEIAHALAGAEAGHGPLWRMICLRLGARPERCGDAEMPLGRWTAVCPTCETRFDRFKRPPRNRLYSCAECGEERGKLKFRAERANRVRT